MRFLFGAGAVFFCSVTSFPVQFTNTVIPPIKKIISYKIVKYYVKNFPSIIVTREIKKHGVNTFFYFIDRDSLSYGITDEWGSDDFTNNDDGNVHQFNTLQRLQSFRHEPFGNGAEKFSPENQVKIVLTSDLCPTSRPFARNFYECLTKFSRRTGRPVPIVIFFSGRWIENHPLNLEEIKKYPINFIAGNHTYDHPIISGGYLKELLISEVTNTERIMIENGILPSYLFRFPGLMHTASDIDCINSINIIALDANVWMGEHFKNWNVLLVHSNGNAETEVNAFTNFLEKPGKITFTDAFKFLELSLISTNN